MDTKQKKQTTEEIEESEGIEETNENVEIEELKKDVEAYKAKYMRALADYQNLEKRSREERMEWIKNAGRDIILHMLPVLDTLMLASKHSKDDNLLISIAQFLDSLKAEGVTRIETKGKNFDPALMEAIQAVDGEEGKVIEEIRAGFMLHDHLLRAAEVTVGKKS